RGASGQGGAQGGARGGARAGQQVYRLQTTPQGIYVAPSGTRVIEVQPSVPGGDPDCSPSRVHVQGLHAGHGAVVVELPSFEGLEVAALDPQWAEDMAEWAEEFAEAQAEAWEDAQEDWEEQWEDALETWGDEMEAQFEEFDECESFGDCEADECESFGDCEAVECEDACDEVAEEPAEIVRSLFQPVREFGARLASDVRGAADTSSLFRVVSNGSLSNETLRTAVEELRGEVDGVRSALRDLKVKIQELRGVQPR
ncbi:MAG: hypothetical protein HUU28_11090, partial [Planctomycetaceae bacterium]|nr:hypothetical protein [Planctomycetaceae bacterium]